MHRTETDGELVAEILAGDRQSFAALVERHVERATALAVRLLDSRAEAEDVVQEAVLQAYLSLRELRDPNAFGAWFCAIATNLAKMRLRQTRGRLIPLDDFDGRLATDDGLEARERLAAIHEALAGLSPSEREAVLLHYVGGLTTPEIAHRGGERVGTVRVRLHRARRRLQAVLAAFNPATRRETTMIEVEVRDVVVRVAPNGDEGPQLASDSRIVLLSEKAGAGRTLPIWVGSPEGNALGMHLVSASTPRPMTFDLVARLLEATGARIERVVVSSLREETFYAAVHLVAADGATHEVDARPSDGINLAVRVGAPILVDEEVFESAGFATTDEQGLDREFAKALAKRGEEPPPGEWRSLTPDLMWLWAPPPSR